MSDGLLITTRRSFLVRAAGFIATVSPAAAAAAIAAKPDLPVITPEIVEKLAAWKAAYWKKQALHDAYMAEIAASPRPSVKAYPSERLWKDAENDYWEAHHAAARLIFGIKPHTMPPWAAT
jgi:hypothetical protein